MTTEDLKSLTVTKSVDARGTACPGPLLEAKKAIGLIMPGEVMEVLSADEGTKLTYQSGVPNRDTNILVHWKKAGTTGSSSRRVRYARY